MTLGSFTLDIQRFAEHAERNATAVIRKIALDVFTRVVMKSPVKTGRFRGNWQVQIGSLPGGVLELDDKSGTATISKITAAVLGLKAGEIIFLANNLPYGRRLEYGYSKQAPAGMVRITLQEFGAIVDNAARTTVT